MYFKKRVTVLWKKKKNVGCLNVGTVPTYEMHNIGKVPTFKIHNVGTVPRFKIYNVGTPKITIFIGIWNLDCMAKIKDCSLHQFFT